MISAILFAVSAVVTGTMDVTPDWLPQVCDFASIVASCLGIKVVIPTKETELREDEEEFQKPKTKVGSAKNAVLAESVKSPD